MGKFIDLTDKIFGRLKVLNREGVDKDKRPVWNCICECGKNTIVKGNLLRRGETKSCGCLLLENNRKRAINNRRKVPDTLISIYKNMKSRCLNPKNKMYYRYGKRGITICDRWLNSYENFYNDLISNYKLGLQLDRIDNDGIYSPENTRWVTQTENIQNSSSTKVNTEIVKIIRESNKTTKELQKEFKMSRSAIKDIKYNRAWINII